jgi:hypothetical protein
MWGQFAAVKGKTCAISALSPTRNNSYVSNGFLGHDEAGQGMRTNLLEGNPEI